MKVVTLLGSARKKGNTATTLGWLEDELTGLGHEVERFDLTRMEIKGCLGCGKCKTKSDEPGCVQKDDAHQIFESLMAADAAIIASPLYFWGFSGPTKTFIDRTYSLVQNYATPDHASLVKGLRLGLLVTAADPYQGNGEEITTSYDRIADHHLAVNVGHLFVGETTTADKLPPDVQRLAAEMARRLVEEPMED